MIGRQHSDLRQQVLSIRLEGGREVGQRRGEEGGGGGRKGVIKKWVGRCQHMTSPGPYATGGAGHVA